MYECDQPQLKLIILLKGIGLALGYTRLILCALHASVTWPIGSSVLREKWKKIPRK